MCTWKNKITLIVKSLPFLFIWIGLFCSSNILAEGPFVKINQERVFNLRSAAKYAMDHSPRLRALRRALDVSELKLKNSLFVVFPKFDVSSSHTLYQGYPEVPTETKVGSFNVNATENLYNNGKDINNYRKAKLQLEINRLQYRKGRDQLIRDVAVDFLDLSLQKKLYEIQKANLDIYREQYKYALRKYKDGLKTQKDVLRLRNQMHRAEINILQYANQIKFAKNRLLTKLGIKPIAVLAQKVDFEILDTKLNIKDFPTAAPLLKEQYEYKNFVLQEKVNEIDVTLAKRDFLPQLNVTAGAGVDTGGKPGFEGGIRDIKHKQQFDMNVRLELKYRIFDWGTDSRNILIAKKEGKQTLDNLRDQLLGVQQELSNLMLNLKQHKLSYKISSGLKKSEQKSYNAVEKLYRNGRTSYLDLINAIDDLSAARTQNITDGYILGKDLYKYYYNEGIVYEKIFR